MKSFRCYQGSGHQRLYLAPPGPFNSSLFWPLSTALSHQLSLHVTGKKVSGKQMSEAYMKRKNYAHKR